LRLSLGIKIKNYQSCGIEILHTYSFVLLQVIFKIFWNNLY